MREALIVFVIAFAVVFVGMGILTAALFALRAISRRVARRAPAPTDAAAEDPELVAVLAAAAYTAIGRPVHVHRVHVHRERATEGWARAGRMDIMVSHRMEPKR
jgi:hypothetical protein